MPTLSEEQQQQTMQKACKIARALQTKFPSSIVTTGRMPDKRGNIVYLFTLGDAQNELHFTAFMESSFQDIKALAYKVYSDFGGNINGHKARHAGRKG